MEVTQLFNNTEQRKRKRQDSENFDQTTASLLDVSNGDYDEESLNDYDENDLYTVDNSRLDLDYVDSYSYVNEFKICDFILQSFITGIQNSKISMDTHHHFYFPPLVNIKKILEDYENKKIKNVRKGDQDLNLKEFYSRLVHTFFKKLTPFKFSPDMYMVISVFDEDKNVFGAMKTLIKRKLKLKKIENKGKTEENISFNMNIPIMYIFTGNKSRVKSGTGKTYYTNINIRQNDNGQFINILNEIIQKATSELNNIRNEYLERKSNSNNYSFGNNNFNEEEMTAFELDTLKPGVVFCNPKMKNSKMMFNDHQFSILEETQPNNNEYNSDSLIEMYISYNSMIKYNKKTNCVNLVIYTHYCYNADFQNIEDFQSEQLYKKITNN